MIILEYFLSNRFSLPDFKAAAGAFHLGRFFYFNWSGPRAEQQCLMTTWLQNLTQIHEPVLRAGRCSLVLSPPCTLSLSCFRTLSV